MKTKLKLVLPAMLIIMVFIIGACGGSNKTGNGDSDTSKEKVTLKAVTAWSEGNTMNDAFLMLQQTVAEKSEGRLEIVHSGGPESIPPFELSEAVRSGVVDIAWNAHTYNCAQIPVLEGAKLSRLAPWEEREKGVYDFLNKLYQEKMNCYYLGKGTPGLQYNLYMNKKPEKLEDFKGMSIRVTPAYQAFVQALGAAPVTTDPSEVYTALERKMIDGYGWPSVGITDFGWGEKTKYVIEPAFYQVDVVALVNLDSWGKLDSDLQQILVDSMEEVERQAFDHFSKLVEEEREMLKSQGIEVVQLPQNMAEQYLDAAYNAGWDSVLQKDPELGQELQKLCTK